ncbi:MAG: glycosyltransferase family 2 protein [Candidatus Homeothermus sp.]|jgi:predicted glycosyltransferase|nr:glycosyltransferase family 2 protein [Candidatus Homeothermus sp.]
MFKIGIVIVSYCGEKDTLECINSIISCNDNISKTIVVIDNASPKNIITEKSFINVKNISIINDDYINYNKLDNNIKIKIINSPINGGFGYGNNIGIKYLQSHEYDIVILLNNDTIVPDDFFKKIYKYFVSSSPKTAISIKSINYYNHKIIDSTGFGYFDLWTGRSSHVKHYNLKYLVGSCIVMNSLKSIPLFDEDFFLYCEDVDYSQALLEAGYKLDYDPQNTFYHKVNASTSKNTNLDKIKLTSMKILVKKRGKLRHRISFSLMRSIYYLLNKRLDLLCKLWFPQ